MGGVGRLLALPSKPFKKLAGLKGKARIIVWGLLAVIVVVGLLTLRGGRDDEVLVRDALARYEKASADKDVQTLCDELFASSFVRQTASSGLPCEVALRTALEDVSSPKLEVLSVEVNGDRALARVRGTAAGQVPGESNYTLVREGDAWRILPPRSGHVDAVAARRVSGAASRRRRRARSRAGRTSAPCRGWARPRARRSRCSTNAPRMRRRSMAMRRLIGSPPPRARA